MNTIILDRRIGDTFSNKPSSDSCADERLMQSLWSAAIKNYGEGSSQRQLQTTGQGERRAREGENYCCFLGFLTAALCGSETWQLQWGLVMQFTFLRFFFSACCFNKPTG